MKRWTAIAALFGVLGMTAAVLLKSQVVFPEAAVLRLDLLGQLVQGQWAPIADGSHNAFYMWRWDPLIAQFAAYIPGSLATVYHTLCLLIGAMGVFSLALRVSPGNVLGALITACAWTAVVICGWGADELVVSASAWFPWLALAAATALASPRAAWLFGVITLLFAWRVSASANQLALLWSVAALFAALTIVRGAAMRRGLIVGVVCLAPALCTLVAAARPSYPAYPAFTRVVPDDGVAGMIRPWVGPDGPDIPVIDRSFVRKAYGDFSLALLGIAALAWALAGRTRKDAFITAALSAAALCAADTRLPESIVQILPLSTINRLIPHFFFFPLVVPAAAMAWLFLLLHLCRRGAVLSTMGAVLVLLLIPYADTGGELRSGALQHPWAQRAFHEFEQAVQVEPAKAAYYHQVLCSPSLHILNKYGFWLAVQRERLAQAAFVPLRDFDPNVQLDAFKNNSPEQLDAVIDRSSESRWCNSAAEQKGGEWFAFRFSAPRRIGGLSLSPGAGYISDFPRGLRLTIKRNCGSLSEDAAGYDTIAEFPEWEGRIAATPEGFPYHTSESRVEVIFPELHEVQCLRIEQTGATPSFDWSISEIAISER